MSKSILIVINDKGKMAMEISGLTMNESIANLEIAKFQILHNQTQTLAIDKMKRGGNKND